MQHQSLNFQQAVETLAEFFHVSLQKEQVENETPLGLLKDCLDKASEFYQFYLLHHPEGMQALDYLYQRHFSLEFIKKYKIGFAPYSSGLFLKWMSDQKIPRNLLQESGLLNQSGKEFFQGRILFPVYNARGGVVGFSGRKIKEETFGGKYINTPETPLFKKSRLLFGLHLSRRQIAKEQKVLVVEGQIDCLRMIDAGWDWTVAALGTAFGEAHVKELLQLGVREAVLLFDGDTAGETAASKVGDLFQRVGVGVKVCQLPLGKDPDSFLWEAGQEALELCIKQSDDYLRFQLNRMQKEQGTMTPAAKHQIVTHLTKQIKGWEEPVMVHETLKRLALLTDLPGHMLGIPKAPPVKVQPTVAIDPDLILELDFLRWLLLCGHQYPQFLATAHHCLPSAFLKVESCRKLYQAYLDGAQDLLALGSHIDDARLLDQIMNKKINLDRAESHFLQTVQKILERKWLEEREHIKQALQQPQTEEHMMELTKRFDALGKQRPQVQLCT